MKLNKRKNKNTPKKRSNWSSLWSPFTPRWPAAFVMSFQFKLSAKSVGKSPKPITKLEPFPNIPLRSLFSWGSSLLPAGRPGILVSSFLKRVIIYLEFTWDRYCSLWCISELVFLWLCQTCKQGKLKFLVFTIATGKYKASSTDDRIVSQQGFWLYQDKCCIQKNYSSQS